MPALRSPSLAIVPKLEFCRAAGAYVRFTDELQYEFRRGLDVRDGLSWKNLLRPLQASRWIRDLAKPE